MKFCILGILDLDTRIQELRFHSLLGIFSCLRISCRHYSYFQCQQVVWYIIIVFYKFSNQGFASVNSKRSLVFSTQWPQRYLDLRKVVKYREDYLYVLSIYFLLHTQEVNSVTHTWWSNIIFKSIILSKTRNDSLPLSSENPLTVLSMGCYSFT